MRKKSFFLCKCRRHKSICTLIQYDHYFPCPSIYSTVSNYSLKGMDMLVRFFTISNKQTFFVTSCLLYYMPIPFWKGVYFGSEFFSYRADPFQEGRKRTLTELPPLQVYQFPLREQPRSWSNCECAGWSGPSLPTSVIRDLSSHCDTISGLTSFNFLIVSVWSSNILVFIFRPSVSLWK